MSESEEQFLAQFDPAALPRVAVTTDIVVLTVRQGQLAVLLVQRAGHPFRGMWALPGGFVEEDEGLDEAARRELTEETGVVLNVPRGRSTEGTGESLAIHGSHLHAHLEQLRTYGRPKRDPRMRVISVAYLAFVAEAPHPEAGSDAATVRYWAIDDLALPKLGQRRGTKLAFDHAEIVSDAVERARSKLEYTTLATAFVDETFTLGELRRVYEAVWGQPLHEGNFRRKVLSTPGFVEPTGSVAPTDGRPAQLYRKGGATRLHPPILRP
ncbi:MAG: NUDIX hydrolase [Acidimicrobiales bacterium]|nr:NUDIX hydrolase [Acidimicrobiales bacterium]